MGFSQIRQESSDVVVTSAQTYVVSCWRRDVFMEPLDKKASLRPCKFNSKLHRYHNAK